MKSDDDKTRTHVVLTKGTMVGHYRIVEKIGAGGMGEVYLAEDTELDRKVALKFLPQHLCQDEDCRARFKREAQAAAKLDHPNIVTVHEVREYQGRPYFAMAHVEGQSLKEFSTGKELSVEQILALGMQICEGLQAAHDKGIIHRDIKPSNILIDLHGRARIVDFGLASVVGKDQLTKTGSTVGTIGYMSPEQIHGQDIDQRSDLFSLGVVLYELITKQNPFARDSEAATLKAVTDDLPEPLARFKSGLPEGLQAVVDRALEKDIKTRYQHADGMLADLERMTKKFDSGEIGSRDEIRSKRYSKILIPSLVVIVGLLLLIFKPWKFEISPGMEAVARENKLAIMYFDNLADPTDSLKLGEITANLLITDLSESDYVQVVSSQRLYDILKQLGREGEKKIDRDIASQIARKANARWMLLGSILNTEPEIILTAQLIEVESGDAVASQRIEGQAGERIFPLVDKLTVEIKHDLSLPEQALEEEDRRITEVTTNSVEAYRNYLKGYDYEMMFYTDEAREYYKKALQLDSTFAMCYYRLAALVGDPLRDSLTSKAIKYASRVTKWEQYIIHGWSLFHQEKYQELVEYMEGKLEEYPDDKETYYVLGFVYDTYLKQPDKAIRYYNSAIELDPYYKTAYNALAYLYNRTGEYDKSIWAINKYIEIAPDEANPYDSRGDLYAYNGNLPEAIESYQKAIEIKPEFMQSLMKLGYMYLLGRDYHHADSMFRTLCTDRNKGRRSVGRRLLSYIPLYQGRLRDALKALDDAIAGDRIEQYVLGETDNYMLKAEIYIELNRPDTALTELEKVIDLYLKDNPHDWIYFRYLYASDLAGCGEFEKALSQAEIHRQEIEKNDTSAMWQYWYALGSIEMEQGNYDKAAVYFEKTYEDEDNFGVQYLLAVSYLKLGDLGKAVTTLEKALNKYNVSRTWNCTWAVRAYYYLGLAYEMSGWNDKAIEQYEIFLDIWKDADPGIEEIEDAKARLANLKTTSLI
jgi:serine/threonine protein kinase/Tfp pilus assembly protein PilF